MGNGSLINAGEIQVMTAGTGITHSEYNPSSKESMRFLQIWIIPEQAGLTPSYQQPEIKPESMQGKLCLMASNNPVNGAAKIHQQTDIYISKISQDNVIRHVFTTGHKGWLHVAKGRVQLNDLILNEGDGVAISDENKIMLSTESNAEIVPFDLT